MYSKTSLILLLTLCIIIKTQAQTPVEKGLNAINEHALKGPLTFLSSNWLEGREATTRGAYMASDYLASIYLENKLTPAIGTSFYSEVPLVISHQPKEATLRLIKKGTSKTFAFPHAIRAQRLVESYTIEGSIIWGGYGINHKQIEEINTKHSKGKILISLKGLPRSHDEEIEKPAWLLDKKNNEWLELKKRTRESSGVIAILEYDLNDPHLRKSFDETPINNATPLAEKELSKYASGIYQKSLSLPSDKNELTPYLQVSKAVMNELIPNFDQQLKQYISNLAQNKAVPIKTFNYNTIQLSATAHVEHKKCRNVVAMIKGSTYPDEIIVVGAHYDHLGSYNGHIWNGADDNGSGAIGVVTIAKAFLATGVQPKRTILFANWTAEERGLHGSRHFVNTYRNIDKVKYYHNYDMIGRSANHLKPDSAVTLLYTKTWNQAEELCKLNNQNYSLGLKINYSAWDNPTSGSDNAPFARLGIPIMWFHTGGHESYHMPGDHVEKIDWQKLEAIVKTSFLTLWTLANE